MLHDFGGNMGLFGKLYNIMSIPYEAKSQSSTTLLGIIKMFMNFFFKPSDY